MENLELWWEGLDSSFKLMWILSISSSAIFIAMFAMSMFGHDTDTDADADGDISHDGDINGGGDMMSYVFSMKSIIAFLMGASWTGLSALYQGASTFAVVAISLLSGLIMMAATAFVISLFMKLQQDSSMKRSSTVGCIGEVYLTIPGNRKPGGQVEIMVNNSYKTFEAICEGPDPLKPTDKILVLEVLDDNVLLVSKMTELYDNDNPQQKLNK